MKNKHLFFNILICISIAISLICLILSCIYCNYLWNCYYDSLKYHSDIPVAEGAENFDYLVRISCTVFCALLALLVSCLICEIILFNPKLFRRSTWVNLSEEWAKNRQERAAARSAKAEADKQKRIEELQAELQELKKDE